MSEESQRDALEQAERRRMSAPELSWALRELNRAAAQVDHALAGRLNLRLLEYAAMDHVMSAESPLGPVELSQRLGISTGSGSELVDRLERAGHLERRRDHSDRRRVTLHPTTTTVDRVLRELRPLFDQIDALAAEFSPEEQAAISRYLRTAARHMRSYGER